MQDAAKTVAESCPHGVDYLINNAGNVEPHRPLFDR